MTPRVILAGRHRVLEEDVEYRLDMSVMLALHDALRRDLVIVARIAARPGDDPGTLLRAALGWELFKKFLVVHHRAEDDILWPVLREAVAGHPDRLALADALEAEHSVIEPLLAAVDAAGADPDHGHERFGDLVDELVGKLTTHLAHEEADGLALIDLALPEQQWQRFGAEHGRRLLPDAALYMPWLLDGKSPEALRQTLERFPPHLATAFREQWAPAYAGRDVWNGR
ncbi:hemerythrin domain-containing protein [Streptomyces sp. PRB2-1]|uniref:Hemerythrin domain-containing protein n=1 Tax=Actinacidiphila epipremni TaxID=2053013 RepID=A0ABX0ZRZ8_9ACTN|nr:hemerythrin domain-containing protein [Actinacidiphila epipremni]